MRRFVPITATVFALALMSPISVATWYAYGSHEPDNSLDTTNWMWADAPSAGQRRVYFNVVTTYYMNLFVRDGPGGNTLDINPNVGGNIEGLGINTRHEAYTMESHVAILGVWNDCNGDGYIGNAESALREYKADLLLDKSRCPDTTGTPNSWNGAHNYRGWVSELIPIAGKDPDEGEASGVRDLRVYKDPEAMVWGDNGLPGQPSTETGGSCALQPFPRGTMSSTGGMINYADCEGARGVMESWNDVWSDEILIGDVAIPGPGDPLGLRFENEQDARGWVGDVETFGSEDSSHSAVRPFNCDAEPLFRAGDVLNDSGLGEPTSDDSGGGPVHNLMVRPVSGNPVGNTADPTIPGTLNETNEEFDDCDTSNDRGADFYGIFEDDFNSNTGEGKDEAQYNFEWDFDNRGDAGPNALTSGNSGAPDDFGVGIGGSGWDSPPVLVKAGPAIIQTRGTVTGTVEGDDPLEVDFPEPNYLTFFAYVGVATTARGFTLPGGTGIYGTEQCGSNDSGIHNGWDCDADNWNLNPDGSPIPEDGAPLAKVGSVYRFRDVDCQDGGSDGAEGVGIAPAAFGPYACQ